jgi:hypothetical protein
MATKKSQKKHLAPMRPTAKAGGQLLSDKYPLPLVFYAGIEPESIDLTPKEKAEHLRRLIKKVLEETDRGPAEETEEQRKKRTTKLGWMQALFMFIIWHESERLTKRVQRQDGIARGIAQIQPATAWDVLVYYVLKDADRVKNLAKAAGVTPEEMQKVLDAFVKAIAKGKIPDDGAKSEWPPSQEDEGEFDQSSLEKWLKNNDIFCIKFMRYIYARFKDANIPTTEGVSDPKDNDRKEDPYDKKYRKKFAEAWEKGWHKSGSDSELEKFEKDSDDLTLVLYD